MLPVFILHDSPANRHLDLRRSPRVRSPMRVSGPGMCLLVAAAEPVH